MPTKDAPLIHVMMQSHDKNTCQETLHHLTETGGDDIRWSLGLLEVTRERKTDDNKGCSGGGKFEEEEVIRIQKHFYPGKSGGWAMLAKETLQHHHLSSYCLLTTSGITVNPNPSLTPWASQLIESLNDIEDKTGSDKVVMSGIPGYPGDKVYSTIDNVGHDEQTRSCGVVFSSKTVYPDTVSSGWHLIPTSSGPSLQNGVSCDFMFGRCKVFEDVVWDSGMRGVEGGDLAWYGRAWGEGYDSYTLGFGVQFTGGPDVRPHQVTGGKKNVGVGERWGQTNKDDEGWVRFNTLMMRGAGGGDKKRREMGVYGYGGTAGSKRDLEGFRDWVGVMADFRKRAEGRGVNCEDEGKVRVEVGDVPIERVEGWRCMEGTVDCKEDQGPVWKWERVGERLGIGVKKGNLMDGGGDGGDARREERSGGKGDVHEHPIGSMRYRNFNPANFHVPTFTNGTVSSTTPSGFIIAGLAVMMFCLGYAICVERMRERRKYQVSQGRREGLMNPLAGVKSV